MILIIFMSVNVLSAGFDADNYNFEQDSFLIANETIELQQDQTKRESQLLSKEGEFRLKKTVRELYYNHIWTMYRVTFFLAKEIIVMFVAVVFYRLIMFLFIELVPIVVNKMLDFFEGWLRK